MWRLSLGVFSGCSFGVGHDSCCLLDLLIVQEKLWLRYSHWSVFEFKSYLNLSLKQFCLLFQSSLRQDVQRLLLKTQRWFFFLDISTFIQEKCCLFAFFFICRVYLLRYNVSAGPPRCRQHPLCSCTSQKGPRIKETKDCC